MSKELADLLRKHKTVERSDDFYACRAWLELRYRVLKRSNGRCECCGRTSRDEVLHVDHIKPRSTHPELELSFQNLQVLCGSCNLGKGAWDSTDWRMLPCRSFEILNNVDEATRESLRRLTNQWATSTDTESKREAWKQREALWKALIEAWEARVAKGKRRRSKKAAK